MTPEICPYSGTDIFSYTEDGRKRCLNCGQSQPLEKGDDGVLILLPHPFIMSVEYVASFPHNQERTLRALSVPLRRLRRAA